MNRGTPKWIAYKGKCYYHGRFRGSRIYGTPQTVLMILYVQACSYNTEGSLRCCFCVKTHSEHESIIFFLWVPTGQSHIS